MNFINNKINLYELLPQSETTILTDSTQSASIIKLFIKICKDVIESLKLFYIEKKFDNFDPHVGEAACQIRALLMYYIYFDTKDIYFYSEIIKNMGEKIYFLESILREPNIFQTYSADKSITKFIEFFELNDKVPTYVIILYLCYVLTKFKQNFNGETFINVEHFMIDYEVSKKKTKKFIHYLQNKIAFYSCEFIFHLSNHYQSCVDLKTLLKYFLKQDDDGRDVLPCYFSMKSIIDCIKKKKIEIFVKINLHGKNFISSINLNVNENGQPVLLNQSSCEEDLPCLFIEVDAITGFYSEEQYLHRLFQYNIHELILNYMAAHPQYSGKKLASFANDPLDSSNNSKPSNIDLTLISREFLNQKFLADERGCSEKNKSTFFIRHIYCENIANLLKKHAIKYEESEKISFLLL